MDRAEVEVVFHDKEDIDIAELRLGNDEKSKDDEAMNLFVRAFEAVDALKATTKGQRMTSRVPSPIPHQERGWGRNTGFHRGAGRLDRLEGLSQELASTLSGLRFSALRSSPSTD